MDTMKTEITPEKILATRNALRASAATKEIWKIFLPSLDLSMYEEWEVKQMKLGIASIIHNKCFPQADNQ